MNFRTLAAVAGAAATGLACAGSALAQDTPQRNFAIGVQGGTTGIGANVQARLGSRFDLRGTADWIGFNHNATYHNIAYRGRVRGATGGVFLDVHPFDNAFMLSAGSYFGNRKLKIDATPSGNVNIGGATFTPAQVGQLNGDIKLSSAMPFVGLGFNNTFRTRSHWSFTGVLGVSFSGSPKVTLDSTGGTFSNDPTFRTYLNQEQATIAHDARNYRYYPVATIGVNYAF
jgi:hypothetical protein